jgi:hypothetical protein
MSSTGYLSTKGVTIETNVPYKATKTACSTQNSWTYYKGTGQMPTTFTLNGNEAALLNIVATNGPAVVAIHASSNFQSYKSGVFTDKTCNKSPNHAGDAN